MQTTFRILVLAAALSAAVRPVLAQASADPGHTVRLGLQGYSPVSYLDEGRAEPGSPRFSAEHGGVTYFLASDQQRAKFRAAPERYLPAYGGWCAYGCAVNGRFTPDPTSFRVENGRTLLFLRNDELDTKALWEQEDSTALKGKADRFWAAQTASRAYLGARNLPASGVALDGYSPVSYFTAGRAEHGDARFQVEHDGAVYHLTSAEQVERFQAAPEKYVPAYGGWCAFGMAIGDKFPVDPELFKIVDGRLMLFLRNDTIDARSLWLKDDERALTGKADAHWRKVSGQ